jgi:hypothetical protein
VGRGATDRAPAWRRGTQCHRITRPGPAPDGDEVVSSVGSKSRRVMISFGVSREGPINGRRGTSPARKSACPGLGLGPWHAETAKQMARGCRHTRGTAGQPDHIFDRETRRRAHPLDLHDIFRSDAGSPLDDMALTEMRKRNLQPRNERLTTAIGPSAPALGPRCLRASAFGRVCSRPYRLKLDWKMNSRI